MYGIKRILELIGKDRLLSDGKDRRIRDFRFVHHVLKRKEIERQHPKYRRWLRIHNMPYDDYSKLRYNKKDKKWVKKNE